MDAERKLALCREEHQLTLATASRLHAQERSGDAIKLLRKTQEGHFALHGRKDAFLEAFHQVKETQNDITLNVSYAMHWDHIC
jgi:hypothetical protein